MGREDKMPLAKDLLHPSPAEEKRKHKLKRLVQHPNSYFMDVKCPGCFKISTVFPRPDRGCVRGVCDSLVPAHWWKGKADRRLLIQEEAELGWGFQACHVAK